MHHPDTADPAIQNCLQLVLGWIQVQRSTGRVVQLRDETVEPGPSDQTAPIPHVPAEELAEYPDDPAEPQAAEVVEEYIQE